MTIEKTYVVNFTEEDKETLRRVYRMIKNFDCDYVSTSCKSCPFHGFCGKIGFGMSNDEEEFISKIRTTLTDCCNDD